MSGDLCLRGDVERELMWEPIVRSAEIGVSVRDCIVTLSGVVDSYAAKRAAERAAARVPGVKAVSTQLEVRLDGSGMKNDSDIAWAAANVLAWNSLVPANRIRVEVSGGWITLDGAADWRFQRTAAEDAVANLSGVVGVTNLIALSQEVPAGELKQGIEEALKRSAELSASRILVEVLHDSVKLWGCVDSPAQRDAAERAAWSVQGVREVSNHITCQAAVVAAS